MLYEVITGPDKIRIGSGGCVTAAYSHFGPLEPRSLKPERNPMLVNLTAHPTLAIRLLCPPPELAERVPQLLSEVRSAVGSQGLRVAGSAVITSYSIHYTKLYEAPSSGSAGT